ncbi:DNA starvation/stationary phase protection protein [Treponema sp. OMZ 840]|uniref:Dps family protein n=1 Tax=Treponema sp. OMZ 840 TaxID=244313 RepID=UPI003D90E8BA
MSNVTKRLSVHTADFAVLYVKLHNYHWHVKGLEFRPIHELTESYYEKMTGAYDAVAERLLQLGEKAPSTMKEYLEVSGIKEEGARTFTPVEVIKMVLADFEYLAKELQVTRTEAADNNDSTTDSILTGLIEHLEKEIWMLKSMQN